MNRSPNRPFSLVAARPRRHLGVQLFSGPLINNGWRALLGFFVFMSANPLGATTYYVANAGADSNSGSLTQPWRTIQKAANILAPGDTVLVRSGTYNERVTVNVSGSATGGLISFQAYPGETPVVDGTGLTAPSFESALFFLADKAYVLISGFEIRNYKTTSPNAVPAGIFVEGASHDIQLLNNKIHGIENNYNGVAANAFGVAFYGTSAAQSISNVIVDGNEVYNLKTGSSESMTFNGNVELFQVTNNLVHDNNNIGIDFIGFEGTCPDAMMDQARNGICKGNTVWNIDTTGNPAYKSGSTYDPSADGIYVDGGAHVIIERNLVFTCDLGIEVSSEHAGHFASYITVRDNFIHHCLTTGISTGGYATSVGWAQNCTFTNNTLFENDTLAQGNGELELQYNVTNCLFTHNILYAGSQNLLISNAYTQNSGNMVDYNVYFAVSGNSSSQWQWKAVTKTGFSAYKTFSGNDANSFFLNPQFIATSMTPNLHLQPTSPAIDAGDPAFVPGSGELDFDGNPRVIGSRVDIGADEVAPFERWQFTKFSAAQLSDPLISGDLADPDGDQLPNLLEYALGTEPWLSNGSPVACGIAADHLTLTFTRVRDASDITYHVQSSSDLINWAEVWSSATVPYTGTNPSVQVTVSDTATITGTTRRFMRLQVTRP
jgi:hypothetical protein